MGRQSTAVKWDTLLTTESSFALMWNNKVKFRAGFMWISRLLDGVALGIFGGRGAFVATAWRQLSAMGFEPPNGDSRNRITAFGLEPANTAFVARAQGLETDSEHPIDSGSWRQAF